MLNKHRVLAITKSDLLDDELIDLLSVDLPTDLPVVFISAVAGKGIQELKDCLWKELNSESNKLQAVSEGGSIIHRDREVRILDQDFKEWEPDFEEETDEDILDLEDIEILDD